MRLEITVAIRLTKKCLSSFTETVFVLFLLTGVHSLQALALDDFSGATVIFESDEKVDNYRLGLGAIKKIDSRWTLEREQRLSGQLSRQTLQFSEESSIEEVFEHYRQQLLQMSARELFFCQTRRCGSSNAWANTHFHIKQLYGLDSDQYYSAFEIIAADDSRSYVALYGVRRGNKRNYLQIDTLKTTQAPRIFSSAEAIVERLREGQSVSFVDAFLDDGQLDEQHLMSLMNVMRRHPSWVVGVVGHNFSPQPFAQQLAEAENMVLKVKQQLVSKGVDATRLQTFALGGLVPGVRVGKQENLMQIVLIGQ